MRFTAIPSARNSGRKRSTCPRRSNRIAPVALARIARRQEDQDGAVDGVALERLATNGDALDDGGASAGDDIGDGSLDLTGGDFACAEPNPSAITATRYTSSFTSHLLWRGRPASLPPSFFQLITREFRLMRRAAATVVDYRFLLLCGSGSSVLSTAVQRTPRDEGRQDRTRNMRGKP